MSAASILATDLLSLMLSGPPVSVEETPERARAMAQMKERLKVPPELEPPLSFIFSQTPTSFIEEMLTMTDDELLAIFNDAAGEWFASKRRGAASP